MTRRKIQYWVIPPQADAEFVAHMEQVLDLYQKPYDPDCPVVCMDEQPVQLVKETRPPMAATKNRPRRVDYEYERAGTAAVFLFSEPLAGWRQATARARRTKVDWALEVAGLLDGRYADCPKITLVCDHLNTHTKGAFYQVFEPARARELVRRIEFCHTPKHGSWLTNAGHPFFERLNRVLDEAGFDAFVEGPLKPGSSAGMVGTVIATATLTVGILRLIG